MSAEDWESLVEWVENLEDAKIAKQAFADLAAANGDRQKAGWLAWDSDAELTVDVFAVRKRPPYDYGDLDALRRNTE